ncbi:MAG TPA: XRE family transcriptional regulator [Actinomycetota bacterium]|nr:XRE family transcriptional regulator [Actinomycetota bacterium]
MPSGLLTSIAESLRAARIQSGYTLDQLAERAGLSKAYLSRLESAERQPSVATLLDLGRLLGVPLSALLGEGPEGAPLSIHSDAPGVPAGDGLTIAPCSGFAGSRSLEAVRLRIEPGRTPPPFARHRGEEWIHVLGGVLRLEYDGSTHRLEAGGSAHFDAGRNHRLGAEGGTAEVIVVAADTPPDRRLNHH